MASESASFTQKKAAVLCSLIPVCFAMTFFRSYVIDTDKASTAFWIITAVLIAVIAVVSFLFRKEFGDDIRHGTPVTTFAAAITGFLLVTSIVASLAINHEADHNLVISLLTLIFEVLSAFYFILSAASSSFCKKTGLLVTFSLTAVLFFAFRILNDFINTSTMPLANSGGYHILSMISVMLFLLFESKTMIGKGNPFFYLFFGLSSILLLFIYDGAYLMQYIQGVGNGLSAIYSLLDICVAIYITIRIATFPGKEPKAE